MLFQIQVIQGGFLCYEVSAVVWVKGRPRDSAVKLGAVVPSPRKEGGQAAGSHMERPPLEERPSEAGPA